MASDPNASYLPASFKFQHQRNGWDFAVKTGTTNDNYDGLMTSWSTKYAVVTWVGYHTRNHPLTTSMEYLTEPLARGWMEAAHANLKPVNWQQPSDIKTLPAFIIRNKVSALGEIVPSPATDLFPSWYQPKSTAATTQTIDKVSGKLATSCTPDAAKETLGNSNANSWNVDIFAGGNVNPSSVNGTDNVHNCGDTPPSVTVTAPATCPEDTGCTITATITQGTHPLSDPQYPNYPGTVNFTVNGQVIKSFTVTDSPSTVSFNYTPTGSGSFTISAQVTDSVLYSGSGSATTTGTPAATAPAGGGTQNGTKPPGQGGGQDVPPIAGPPNHNQRG